MKNNAEILGKLPTTTMSPEDIDVVSGGNAIRLKFVDKILSTTDKKYLTTLREFKKILKQRNKALATGDPQLVVLWNKPLCLATQELWKKRDVFFDNFGLLFKNIWAEDQEKNYGTILYGRKQPNNKKDFLKALESKTEKEILMKTTTLGAHRDSIELIFNDKILKESGSQGEKKIFLINLKLAEAIYVKQILQTPPILLLDDFFEKLDRKRTNSLLKKLGNFSQSIITTTDRGINFMPSNPKNINKIEIHD